MRRAPKDDLSCRYHLTGSYIVNPFNLYVGMTLAVSDAPVVSLLMKSRDMVPALAEVILPVLTSQSNEVHIHIIVVRFSDYAI